MKNLQISITIAVNLLVLGCAGQENKEIKTNQTEDKNSETMVMDKFEAFKLKKKFTEDMSIYYPGISDATVLKEYTENINKSADEFKAISLKEHPTRKEYLEIMKIGLSRFNNVADSEDRERIGGYYEELMNLVGLESSEGLLMNFVYGF